MMTSTRSAAALFALALSCAGTSEKAAVPAGASQAEILVLHGGLAKKYTVVVQNYLARESHGLLEVQVDLKNATSREIAVEYSFEWFDGDGFKMETPIQHWTPLKLHREHLQSVSAIAPRSGAKEFRLHVRDPQEVTR